PLDDGGTNAIGNLVLIKKDPDHYLITQYQKRQTRGMSAGQTRTLEWPMPGSRVWVWPETPDGVYSRRALIRSASMPDIDEPACGYLRRGADDPASGIFRGDRAAAQIC